jgi:uncharacterized protein DUF4038/uncharacterized protein DUF5060/collagenase-like protein with putative collagen-binding domain
MLNAGLVRLIAAALIAIALLRVTGAALPPGPVTVSASSRQLDAYDFIEITAHVSRPRARNPFSDASILATFERPDNGRWEIEGFCDSDDGSVYRVRFMPSSPGDYRYSIEFRQGWFRRTATGTFRVVASRRRGPIRMDPSHPWHFIWENTGGHYFFNGTTAYWLMGWRDDQIIASSIERLHQLRVNRIRVTIAGRTGLFYGEPVMWGDRWSPLVTPWRPGGGVRALRFVGRLGQRSGMAWGRSFFDSLSDLGLGPDTFHPGFDYSRFDVSYWQKFDRALRFARDRDMIVSLILDMNDSRVHPAAGSADERRFIRYAVARFAAFSNITWDLGDDLDRYRDEFWTRTTGTLIKQWDPVRHLATSHPVDNLHQDRTSDWFDFTSFQEWSRTQHAFMLAQRQQQERSGRIIPQTNEEYGYEDHYPLWAQGPGSESADALRRMAWEIVMAGGYQTTGETARRGTNVWPDTGGGWMNGRGDDTMTMLQGYAHMVDFFTSFEWWRANPHDELVNKGNYCLAAPGATYLVYLPRGGAATVTLEPGRYRASWLNPLTGEKAALAPIEVLRPSWTSPDAPANQDWALILERDRT